VQLAERAWLALPRSAVGEFSGPLLGPIPALRGEQLVRISTWHARYERAVCWIGFLYRKLRQLPGAYLGLDGRLVVVPQPPKEGNILPLIHVSPEREEQEKRRSDLIVRSRVTSFGTDVFTASVIVLDILLAGDAEENRGADGQALADSMSRLPKTKKGRALFYGSLCPEWTDEQIAKAAQCSRQSLYRWEEFCRLRAQQKAERESFTRGRKNKDGSLESWAP